MAYLNTSPQPDDQINQSQTEFLENYMQIYNLIGQDHYNFNTGNAGKHIKNTYPIQAGNPVPAPNEAITFSTANQFTGIPEIQYIINAFAGRSSGMTSRQTPIFPINGWATLSGTGLVIKWGQQTWTGTNMYTYPIGPEIPTFTAPPFSLTLSPIGPAGVNSDNVWVTLTGRTAQTFTAYCSQRVNIGPSLTTFFYLAIGSNL